MTYTSYDLVIQTTGRTRAPVSNFLELPPIDKVEMIDSDLSIGPLPSGLRPEIIYDACDPPGLWTVKPIRQWGFRYCFARVMHSQSFHFDHAQYSYFLEQRTASLVASFESLLNTGQYQLAKKSSERVSKLGEVLGAPLDAGMRCASITTDRVLYMDQLRVWALIQNFDESTNAWKRSCEIRWHDQ